MPQMYCAKCKSQKDVAVLEVVQDERGRNFDAGRCPTCQFRCLKKQ